jgi:RNA-directed DNA polymerase
MAIKTVAQLCMMMDVKPRELHEVLNEPTYKTYTIAKKNGGVRNIEAPQGMLRIMQGSLCKYMQPFYTMHKLPCVHGFVKAIDVNHKYGVVSNAMPHLDKPFVLNMDIKNFFDTISAKAIKQALMDTPFLVTDEVSTAIALLCTHQKKLPTGAPTSPLLSNIVFYWVDNALMQLVDEVNQFKTADEVAVTYTRYADDLTFSGSEKLVRGMMERIINILQHNGFEVNVKKTRGQTVYGAQWVTGVKVNQKPNISRLYIRKLRAILHNMQTNFVDDAVRKHFNLPAMQQVEVSDVQKMLNSVRSQIGWVGLVRGKTDELYLKLKNNFDVAERNILVAPIG